MSGEGGSGLKARVLDPAHLKSDRRAGFGKMVLDPARLKGKGGSSLETRVLDPVLLKGKGGSSLKARVLDPARLTEDVDLTKYFSAAAVAKMATIEQNMYRNKVLNYWTLRALGEWGCSCND